MENLINSIKSIKNLYDKNNIKSIDSFLDLSLQNINESSSILLKHSLTNIKERIAVAYLTKLNPLTEEKILIEKFLDYPSMFSKTLFTGIESNNFKNFLSNFKQIKNFIKLIENKLDTENIDSKSIISEYNKVLTHFYDLEKIIIDINKIDQDTMSFFSTYNKLNSIETIFVDFQEFLGDKFNLIKNPSHIIPYTNMVNPSFKNIYDDFKLINDKVLELLAINNESKYLDLASYYHKYKNQESSISEFLFNAHIKTNISTECDFPPHSKFNKFIFFKDNTSIIEYKNGSINKYGFKFNEHSNFKKDIEIELINNILHKKPKISKFFIDKIKEDEDISETIICINSFLKNEQILKNSDINILHFKDKSIESIYDNILRIEKDYKVDQMCKQIMSNKYKHLFDLDTKIIISELYDKGVSTSKLQEFAGQKLALFKSNKEFNNYLDNILSNLSDFSYEALSQKLNLMNISPIVDENNIVLFEVSTFSQSKTLGSKSWCISREEYYFEDYTSENSKQYFLYDFNKSELDLKSMIGFTLYDNGNFRSQHLKNDDYIEVNKFLEELRFKVLDKNISQFKLCEDVEKIYKKHINENIKKIKNGVV